jgi:adenylate cyclase
MIKELRGCERVVGGILISEKVYSEVEGKLDLGFEDRGEQRLKNISRPVRAYAV